MNVLNGKRPSGLCATTVGALMAGAVTFASTTSYAAEEGPAYLALGDSVAFGYIAQAGFEYLNADNFIGYPAFRTSWRA